jgi:hypothetical protein
VIKIPGTPGHWPNHSWARSPALQSLPFWSHGDLAAVFSSAKLKFARRAEASVEVLNPQRIKLSTDYTDEHGYRTGMGNLIQISKCIGACCSSEAPFLTASISVISNNYFGFIRPAFLVVSLLLSVEASSCGGHSTS